MFSHPVLQLTPRPSQPLKARSRPPHGEIHLNDSRDNSELREWKKRNAESMKILEKTTKELPLR